ncbi:hypothetical protein EYZ11_008323 [Aspergillus tanneri]|uniref:FAD/NAD(P)-binding domain-containing protein n=1 Tax=Aspergillus tanneri TaxID=1220188 RepID=A0A4S3JAS6_9EURO|nr:hypothetical protein EYZ11_008323 [Aspergillus tanneri]
MTSSGRLSIAIVGGGFGGLYLAISLLPNKNLDVSTKQYPNSQRSVLELPEPKCPACTDPDFSRHRASIPPRNGQPISRISKYLA